MTRDEDATFMCPTCDQKFHGRKWAYRHINETFGIKIEGEPGLIKFLEKKFLLEVNVL